MSAWLSRSSSVISLFLDLPPLLPVCHMVHLVPGDSLSSCVGLRGVFGLPFTVTLQKKTVLIANSLPSSTGDGERFIDCARRQRNLDSRRGGYQLRVLLHLTMLLSAPMYGILSSSCGWSASQEVGDHGAF